jgi:hypothetical protein
MVFMTSNNLREIDLKKKTIEEIITLLAATLNQNDSQFDSKPEAVVAMTSLTSSPVAEFFPAVL